ncbi:PAS domain-containing protein [Bradyrhizobium sp. USDA 4353]
MSAGDVPSDTARHHPDHELLSAGLREIETIYASARVGLCVLDRDLRYRRVNGRLAEMNGIPAMGHIGKTVREIVPTLADEVERIASRIFETGEPVIDLEISGATPAQPDVERHWIEQWLPLRSPSGEIVGVNVAVEEVTARRRAEAALKEREALLSTMFNSLPVAVAQFGLRGEVILANAEMRRYIPTSLMPSRDPARLIRWRAQHPDGTPLQPHEFPGERALRGERIVPGIDMVYTDDDGRETWTNVACVAVRDTDGRIVGAFAVVADITERKAAEQRERLLMHEVNHRAKNLLSVVQAIARRTAADNPKDLVDRLTDRLQALSASQDVLVKNGWRKVPIEELVRAHLGHFADLMRDRIRLSGPPIEISATAAQALGMALHELATNAAKYGALSCEAGRVDVSWRLATEGSASKFILVWTEAGGPPVSKPTSHGFGSVMTGSMLKANIGGEVEAHFAAGGLVWSVSCPVTRVLEDVSIKT